MSTPVPAGRQRVGTVPDSAAGREPDHHQEKLWFRGDPAAPRRRQDAAAAVGSNPKARVRSKRPPPLRQPPVRPQFTGKHGGKAVAYRRRFGFAKL